MRVICLASQKGGSGKTTLSGHLAVEADRDGIGPVALIDVDPQGSLADWWNQRQAETPLFARTALDRLRGDLDELRRAGVGLVVIDTPPAITMAIQEVIAVSDFVVIPTRPSPHDLRAVGATVKLVHKCRKPLVFVVNAATPRARITSEAAIALSQFGTVAPVTIHQRTDFATSMIDGRTVMEISEGGRSALEVRGLWRYLHTRLEDDIPSTAFHVHDSRDIAREPPRKAAVEPARLAAEEVWDDDDPVEAAPLTAPPLDRFAPAFDDLEAASDDSPAREIIERARAALAATRPAAPPPPPAHRRPGFGRRMS